MTEKPELPPDVATSSSEVNGIEQPLNSATTSIPAGNTGFSAQATSLTSTNGPENAQTSQPDLLLQPGVFTITLTHENTAFKSLWMAYLCWFPLGLIGLHNFYLGRRNFGFLYVLTGGVCGFGWIVDGLRMPSLVRDANQRIANAARTNSDREGSAYIDDEDGEQISLIDAYITWWLYGIFGLHHFYLGRTMWGVAYMFTGGLFGLGWLFDIFRLPELVREANARNALERANLEPPAQKSLRDAYHFGLTPAGLFGAHHFFLGNKMFGIYYMMTAGGFGIGWLIDWIRMPFLVERANNPERNSNGSRRKYLDEAYVLWFPLGLLGFHHFYLNRPKWGMLYLLTGGLCGVGWIRDLLAMDDLVTEANMRLNQETLSMPLSHGVQPMNGGPFEGSTTCTIASREGTITFACQSVVLQLNGHVTLHDTAPQALIRTNRTRVPAAPPPYTEVPASFQHQSPPPVNSSSTDPEPRPVEEVISNA